MVQWLSDSFVTMLGERSNKSTMSVAQAFVKGFGQKQLLIPTESGSQRLLPVVLLFQTLRKIRE